MSLIIKAGDNILDYAGAFAYTDSRLSFYNITSRTYDVIKGLKFPKSSRVNKTVFGFSDVGGASLTTVKSDINVEVVINSVKRLTGVLQVTGNDSENYIANFYSKDSRVETMQDYKLDDIINNHPTEFYTTTWWTLTNQQRLEYMANNTDPAWVFAYIGSSKQPYTARLLQSYNSLCYGAEGPFLCYSLGYAFHEIFEAENINVQVYENGALADYINSDLYANTLQKLATPSFGWSLSYNPPLPSDPYQISPPAESGSVIRFSDEVGTEEETIYIYDYEPLGGLDMWTVLKMLAKYLFFSIKFETDRIVLTSATEIDINNPVDLSDKFVSLSSKNYLLDGYGKNNYIKFETLEPTIKTFGQLTLTQPVDWLNKEKTIFTSELTVAGLYEVGGENHFNCFIPDIKSKPIVFRFDTANKITTYLEAKKGDMYNASTLPQGAYIVDIPSVSFYQPASEFSILQDALTHGECYEVELKLSDYDMIRIKEHTTIKIAQLGGVFILEPFEWTRGKNTTVKLIKIA